MQNRPRFDEIDREQLAAQLVSVMNAHFQRPNAEEKRYILQIAARQVSDEQFAEKVSYGLEAVASVPAKSSIIVD